jgi:membrane protein DedA with SNARE-associated domain
VHADRAHVRRNTWLGSPHGLRILARVRRPAAYASFAVLFVAGFLLAALVEGDLPDVLNDGADWVRTSMAHFGHLGAFGLLYLEESGVPLPAPGDVFVMYAGAHVPRSLPFWIAAWLGIVAVVILGSTNLYLVSRHAGRRLVDGRYARLLHLTPQRLAWAEARFNRWGVLAIIFGRHVPGCRVPITVAAGLLRVRFVTFVASVAVSTAIWGGAWLVVGIVFGGRVESFLRLHRETYWLVPGLIIAVALATAIERIRSIRRHAHDGGRKGGAGS